MNASSKQTSERGSTLVFLAILLVILLGFTGLALDGGHAFLQHRRMQNAADAAALGGVRALAVGGNVDSIVSFLVNANGADAHAWHTINSGTGLHVDTQVTFDTWFMGLFGVHELTATGTSEVGFLPLEGVDCLFPMIILKPAGVDFQESVTYLWTDEQNAPGSFGWVDWNGVPVGNSELVDNFVYPCNSGVWNIGDLVPTGPGVQSSSGVRNAMESLIGQSVTILLYDTIIDPQGSNARYRIAGFARFVLLDYDFQGNNKWVSGQFVKEVIPGPVGYGDVSDYGIRDLRFLQ